MNEVNALIAAMADDEDMVMLELSMLNYSELRNFLDAINFLEDIGYPLLKEKEQKS